MRAINLLDWRTTHLKIANRRMLLAIAIIIVMSSGVIAMLALIIGQRLNYAKEQVKILDAKLLQQQPKLQQLAQLIELHKTLQVNIADLQNSQTERLQIMAIFDDIINIIPAEINLTNLSLNEHKLFICGSSAVNSSITAWLTRLQELAWVASVKLITLKNLDSKFNFEIEIFLSHKFLDKHADMV